MTKEELLHLIKTEDLFTGEDNADTKEWLDREDVLDFFIDVEEEESNTLDDLLNATWNVWNNYHDIVETSKSIYKGESEHISDAIKKELYKHAEKFQEFTYMMIEDLLDSYIDLAGLLEEHEEEEPDTDWYYEEGKVGLL